MSMGTMLGEDPFEDGAPKEWQKEQEVHEADTEGERGLSGKRHCGCAEILIEHPSQMFTLLWVRHS